MASVMKDIRPADVYRFDPTVMVESEGDFTTMLGKVYVDIETRKTPALGNWPQRLRWLPFMAAVAYVDHNGRMLHVEVYDSLTEYDLIQCLDQLFKTYGPEVVYAAGRMDFDKWVLCGRFTNARRSINPTPGNWAHLNEKDFNWVNVAKNKVAVNRLPDVLSKNVPYEWTYGNEDTVRLHCLRDVAIAVLQDKRIDLTKGAENLLRAILEDKAFERKLMAE